MPLFLLFIVIGILTARFTDAGVWTITALLVVALVIGIKPSLRRYSYAILFGTLALYSTNYAMEQRARLQTDASLIYGVVTDVNHKNKGTEYVVSAVEVQNGNSHLSANGKILVNTESLLLTPGDYVAVPGPLEEPDRWQANKGLTGVWNEKGDAEERGIQVYEPVGFHPKVWIDAKLSQSRMGVCDAIFNSGLDRPSAEMLCALLCGDTEILAHDTKALLRDAGLAHILAVSGLHIGIILALIVVILLPLRPIANGKFVKLLAILLLWGFTIFTGASPSAVRSTTMITLILIAGITERMVSSIEALCSALALILLFNPEALFSPGFQFSALCVATLAMFIQRKTEEIKEATYSSTKALIFCLEGILYPCVLCMLASWVLTAYYFELLPTQFILTNLLCVPLLPLLIYLGIAFLILNGIGLHIPLLGDAIDGLVTIIIGNTEILTNGGNSSVNIGVSEITVVLWLVALALAAFAIHSKGVRHRWIGASCAVLSAGLSLFFINFEVSHNQIFPFL